MIQGEDVSGRVGIIRASCYAMNSKDLSGSLTYYQSKLGWSDMSYYNCGTPSNPNPEATTQETTTPVTTTVDTINDVKTKEVSNTTEDNRDYNGSDKITYTPFLLFLLIY